VLYKNQQGIVQLFYHEPILATDLVFGACIPIEHYKSPSHYVKQKEKKTIMYNIHEIARRYLALPSDRQKKHYDHRVHTSTYNIGDSVWFTNETQI
jgi:hypothetical protein